MPAYLPSLEIFAEILTTQDMHSIEALYSVHDKQNQRERERERATAERKYRVRRPYRNRVQGPFNVDRLVGRSVQPLISLSKNSAHLTAGFVAQMRSPGQSERTLQGIVAKKHDEVRK